MSLFPAYKSQQDNQNTTEASNTKTWLNNSSFSIETQLSVQSTSNNKKVDFHETSGKYDSSRKKHKNKEKIKKKRKKKTHHKELNKSKLSSEYKYEDVNKYTLHCMEHQKFYEDKKPDKNNVVVSDFSHSQSVIPKFHRITGYILGCGNIYLTKDMKEKANKFRYFTLKYSGKNKSQKKVSKELDENCSSLQVEQELLQKTAEFNKKLDEYPNNVELWLEYVKFQDLKDQFETTKTNQNIKAERKLAILDKAVKLNPASNCLLKEKLNIMEQIYSPDKVAEDVRQMLEKNPKNTLVWHFLLATVCHNISRCTVSKAVRIFADALGCLHNMRRAASSEDKENIEANIIVFLFKCGTFIQQAGLWEQLVTLFQMYLNLNISADIHIDSNTVSDVTVKQLREKEDTIITSGLILSALWLRTERLRTYVHFIPVTDKFQECDDPQRIVFTEDMASLLHPVNSKFHFHLVVIIIMLFKVPLLPTRQSIIEVLGLEDTFNSAVNIEMLFASVYPVGIVPLTAYRYLAGLSDLCDGPQYVQQQLGCSEYLYFVISMMKISAEHLSSNESVIIYCWILRLYRMLIRLHYVQLTDVPQDLEKKSKTFAKELLKKPLYRENLQLYIEYALVERELNNTSKACQVLETAAKMINPRQDENKVLFTTLCHNLVETLLSQEGDLYRKKALTVLCSLIEKIPCNEVDANAVRIKKLISSWAQATEQVVNEALANSSMMTTLHETLTPQFCVEWIACHAWFLYLTQSIYIAYSMIQGVIEKLTAATKTYGRFWKEQLWEVIVSLLYFHTCSTNSGFPVLFKTLRSAVSEYPYNMYLLHTAASMQCDASTPWWKLPTYFPSKSAYAKLMLVFVIRSKLLKSKDDYSLVNRMQNFMEKVSGEQIIRRCPLFWRVYLQFVGIRNDNTTIKNIFYKAVNECPYAKSLYLDAVQFIPEEFPEIQDLLIEKELRLHTSPEELQILRGDSIT